MSRRRVLQSVLAVAVLTAVLGLAACGSSEQPAEHPADQPPAAGPAATASAAFAAGQSVAARWGDNSLYLATVSAVDGDDVTVTYADDGSSRTVSASADVRAIPDTAFAIGDRVLAVWASGRFYEGAVSKVDGTTYTVKWDDGSDPSPVEAGKIIAE